MNKLSQFNSTISVQKHFVSPLPYGFKDISVVWFPNQFQYILLIFETFLVFRTLYFILVSKYLLSHPSPPKKN